MDDAIKIFESAINEQYENIKKRSRTYGEMAEKLQGIRSNLIYSGRTEIALSVEAIFKRKFKKEVYDLPVKDKSHTKDD